MNVVRDADLVVVGAGPRALSALLALDDALAAVHEARPVRVLLLDPASPGPGAVWDPEQPRHLLMNLDPTSVDFSTSSPLVPYDYRGWETARGLGREDFPPRARMGEYLAWVFERIVGASRLEVRHVQERVTSVTRDAGGWSAAAGVGEVRARHVLLCTGHAGGVGLDHAALVSDLERCGPSSHVVVRGAALTGMDVVLDLTAGRGGTWSADGAVWQPSGREPSRITLVSRSGELMMPKPVVRDPAVLRAVSEVANRWRPGAVPDDEWWDVLLDAAVAAASTGGVTLDREAARVLLDAGHDARRDAMSDTADWRERWRAGLARAEGALDDDPAWWLGRAWSAGYASMVSSLERGPRPEHAWRRWRQRAARLERWAFGPPAVTVRRLLALGDAGLLHVAREMPSDATEVVDAVTRGPGVLQGEDRVPHDDLWASLLAAGHVTVRPGERGAFTLPDGVCVGADGRAVDGLHALGRPTEDPVIGHDTLLRTLHGDVDRWATGLAARLAIGAAAPLDPAQRLSDEGMTMAEVVR